MARVKHGKTSLIIRLTKHVDRGSKNKIWNKLKDFVYIFTKAQLKAAKNGKVF